MTVKELEEIVMHHEASFAFLTAQCGALEKTLLDHLTSLDPELAGQIVKNYYKNFHDQLNRIASDLDDTSPIVDTMLPTELHRLWQLSQ